MFCVGAGVVRGVFFGVFVCFCLIGCWGGFFVDFFFLGCFFFLVLCFLGSCVCTYFCVGWCLFVLGFYVVLFFCLRFFLRIIVVFLVLLWDGGFYAVDSVLFYCWFVVLGSFLVFWFI